MTESIIGNPTYMEHVRRFFEDTDPEHMLSRGVDLRTYPALKAEASRVFQVTRPPDACMPPEPDRKWSQERHQSFTNWIKADGEPIGRQAFFQSTQPTACTGCREKPLIDLDFRSRRTPNPTLNIRLLLQDAP